MLREIRNFTGGLPVRAVAAEPEPMVCRPEWASAVTYVVDGELATCISAMTLPPSRIASVDVLKGAAAALQYPASAADGVIIIRTKRDP